MYVTFLQQKDNDTLERSLQILRNKYMHDNNERLKIKKYDKRNNRHVVVQHNVKVQKKSSTTE